jgi:hypothetical protein
MAVRNPFDQIILDDPAYAEETKIDPQAGKKLVRDIYGLVLGEEDPFAKEKLDRELSVALAQKEAGLPVDPNKSFVTSAERQDPVLGPALDKFGFKSMGLGEFGERAIEFLYRDQEKARSKQLRGEELTLGEKIAANPFMAALDAADFTGLLALATKGGMKLSAKGLQTLNNLRSQGASKDVINQVMTTQFPDDAQKIGLVYYQTNRPPGMETSQIMRAAEDGTGPASSTSRTGTKKDFLINYFSDPKATIKTTTSLEGQGINRKDIANFLQQFPEYRNRIQFNAKDAKTFDRLESGLEKLKAFEGEKIPSKELERIFGLGGKGYLNTILNNKDTVAKGLLTQDQVDYIKSFQTNLSRAELDNSKKLSTIATDLKNNPEFQNLGPTEISNKYKIPLINLQTAISKDPELYALVAKDQKLIGTPDTQMSISLIRKKLDPKADDVDVAIITDLYRGTKNIEDYNPLQFLTLFKKQNPNYKNTKFYKNTKKEYRKLEDERLKVQEKGFKFFDQIKKDPRYGKYLKDSDRLQFGFQKAHAFPIDETTEISRFENMAQMSDMIFVSDVTSNVRLQQRFDGDLIKIGKLGSTENMNRLETIPTNADIKSMGINLPKIIERLKEYGIEVLPEEFQNMRQLIFGKDKGIVDQINNLYQKFDTGTIIPIGKKNYALVGKNPKKVSSEKRLNNLKKRFMKILDDQVLYEKTNGKQGKPIMRQPRRDGQEGGFIVGLKSGGPVKMALGGDPLQNINQQQFSPDPAIDQDYFQEAVQSGNLQAFNPTKIFKLFNKTDAVYTPKKLPDAVDTQQSAPPGTTLPTTQTVQPEDFAFQSFTLNKINDPQAPKASSPEAWKQYLYGGGQGGKVPESEMFDSGLEQYLDDFSKYYPNQKITQQQLNDYYEMSPIGNIEIKVKQSSLADDAVTDPAYRDYTGRPRHKSAGNQPLDNIGTDYREVVVNSGPLPGDKKPFVASSHFEEKNVLGFTRVANYTQPDGKRVAVIQEMQTDMLTKVRKEQERLQALLKRIENLKARANRDLQTGDDFRVADANRILDNLNSVVPPVVEEALQKHADLIKPFPNEAARSTIPDYQKQLTDLQSQIDTILSKDIQQSKPETGFMLKNISNQQQEILDSLLDLNRSGQLDDLLKNIKVPTTGDTDDLIRYGEDTNVRSINDGANYYSLKELELFPPIPFNKQADYVDLLLKSTIKDAQSRGINKVAIYPPNLVNQRWGKAPDSDAGKKFRDLYGKVAIQQMKNIAKKYGGTAQVETVMNPNLSDRGLTYYKRNLEGEYEYLKQDQLAQGLEPEEAQLFINEQLKRNANTLGANQVIYSREIAPGQTMDYYVQPKTVSETTDTGRTADFEDFELVPLGPGDDRNAAQVLIEEYDPRKIQMFTITLDSDKAQKPMFMFKKKSGGTIAKDSLLSITDIYGEYGR